MDRVPIRFIQEVLLQLEENQFLDTQDRKYPSIWAEVANKKRTREGADLLIYLTFEEEVLFCVFDDDGPVELDRIGQFVLDNVFVEDLGEQEEHDWIWEIEELYPVTKKNFHLLHSLIRKPFPCHLEFNFQTDPIDPLVQRLCLAIPWVAGLRLNSQMPLSMDILTRSVERGTLKYLFCHVDVTVLLLPVLLRFVASEKMDKFEATPSDDSPISYEALLNGVIDAV
uniref:DUF3786 domain-containing protein n=1 Tax=Steinernema glaseri TaxID=37863 RepID=A0A1I8ABJ3_9BILA